MVQQNSIPQQILHFYQTSLAEEAYFRGTGEIGGVPSTIILSLTDFARSFALDVDFLPLYGHVAFNGEIRNPFERQIFSGDITQLNTGFVRFQDGFPGTLVQLDFTDNQLAATVGPFREQTVTYTFQYEPTTQNYALGYLYSLPPNFDALQYGASHPDLITHIGMNLHGLIEHYLYAGQAEGRALDTFDEVGYLAANPDLFSLIDHQSFNQGIGGFLQSKIIPHYIQLGFYENRPLAFDASAYLASNPDLINPLQGNRQQATLHYVSTGHFEERPRSTFDSQQYLASYPDLVAAFGVNLEAAKNHFVDSGYSEGRSADNFPEFRYIASYIDLIQHFGLDGVGATHHYLNFGQAEGRNPFIFDPSSYMNLNPDVNQAFGGDPLLATKHYIEFGWAEGRAIG